MLLLQMKKKIKKNRKMFIVADLSLFNCDIRFLVERMSALLCFLNSFGIAVLVFSC